MNKEFILGCHVSLSSPDYYLGSVNEALSHGANTFMIYTGAPQNSYRLPTERLNINKGKEALKKSGMNSNHIIAHAPYIINLGNSLNPSTAELAVDFLKKELQRVADFGIKTLVLHPGSHVGAGEEEGLKQIIKGLNEVLANDNNDDVIIALETMAGKGSEIGYKFEHIRHIIDNVDRPERLGVCLDTCHISDAGYDVTKVDEVLKEFDEVIGLERLRVVHVNDSKNERGARKDRHENLGYGTIGFETISKYVHHPLLAPVPKILETPYYDKKPPYKAEIAMLRAKQFNKNWRDSL